MKSVVVLFAFQIISFSSYTQCTPNPSTELYTITPNSDSIPCIVMSVEYSTVLQFYLMPEDLVLETYGLDFDSIAGLPNGITYEFNKPDGRYAKGEKGCVTLSGTTSQPGHYPLYFYATGGHTIPGEE